MKPRSAGKLLLLLVAGLQVAAGREPEGYTKQIKVTPILQTTVTASGQPIRYPRTNSPQVTAVQVVIPSGAETGWHIHPFPCYAYILSGTLTVEIHGKSPRVLHPGDALVETVNTLHNGTNKGSQPVRLVMFVTGEAGKPFTVRRPAPSSGKDR